MKMLALSVLTVLLAAGEPEPGSVEIKAEPAATLSLPAADCPFSQRVPADSYPPIQPDRLSTLPDGDMVLAVYRTEDGCVVPQVVEQKIGSK